MRSGANNINGGTGGTVGLTTTAGGTITDAGGTVTANILNLNNAGAAGTSTLANRLKTAISTLNLNTGGNVFINQTGALNVLGTVGGTTLDLLGNNNLTFTGTVNMFHGDGQRRHLPFRWWFNYRFRLLRLRMLPSALPVLDLVPLKLLASTGISNFKDTGLNGVHPSASIIRLRERSTSTATRGCHSARR